MAEAQGQAEVQQPAIPESLNPHEAAGILAQQFIKEEEAANQPAKPRDEKGKFTKETSQPEAKTEEAKPEGEAAEGKAEEAKPEEEAEIQPEPRRFKLKYKGEEMEKDETEVINLAQQGFDYTQKSQALAKEREEVQAKVKAETEAARSNYEKQLEVQKQAALKLTGVKSMSEIEQLAKTDPAGAQQEFLRAIAVNQFVQSVEAEQQKIAQQRHSEVQETLQKQARESVERLQERIPGWSQELYGKILKSAVDVYGFKQQEVSSIADHRAIEVLNDARQWREYQAAKPKTVEKRVVGVPKVTKPGTTQEKSNPASERFSKSYESLKKTGSRNDAVDAVRMLIEAGKL